MVIDHDTLTMKKPPAQRLRRSQEDRSRETRLQILEAALKVMLKSGYVGFRIADVAKRGGVSRGAILHHFPTKDDLVVHTIEHAYERALARSRSRATHLDASEDPLEAMIADSKEFYFGDFFFLLATMGVSKGTGGRAITAPLTRQYRLPAEYAWQQTLEARGIPRELAEDAVWLALSVVRGLAIRTAFQNEPERFQRLFDLFREIFWTYWDVKSASKPSTGRVTAKKTPRR